MKKSCSWAALAATGLLAMVGMAGKASAQCTTYTITSSSGATILPGATDVTNHGDDVTTAITLPFTTNLYGLNFTQAVVCSNGQMVMGATGTTSFSNACLPTATFSNVALCPHWDDMRTDGTGRGIFTATYGTSPNQAFVIEWRAGYFSGPTGTANFEVILYENHTYFDFIYGTINDGAGGVQGEGASATVGVQKTSAGPFTQNSCNSGVLTNGLQLRFDCPASTPPSCSLSLAPSTGPAGSSFNAFCTVTPGTGPNSTGLAASLNATSVGGGTVALHDDGVAPDVAAGDNIFSGSVTTGAVAPAAYTVTSTVSDAQARSSTCNATFTVIPPPPPNDECANAIPAVLGNNAFDSTTATTSSPAAACGALGSDLWYTFTPASSGTLTVATCGLSGSDTALAIYSNCTTSIACNDDFCGLQSTVSACVNANQTYLLRIGGFAGAHWVGSFNVALTPPSGSYSPPGDAVAEGEPCDYNINDTVNGGCNFTPNLYTEASLCHSYSSHAWNTTTNRDTDWYHFTMPAAGNLIVQGQTQFNTNVFVYNYPCPAATQYAFSTFGASCGGGATAINMTVALAAGEYTFIVVPANFNGDTVCGTNDSYWFSLNSDTFNCNGSNPPVVVGNTSSTVPGGSVLITGTVTPGTNPTSTGLAVTGDLTSIGGSASQAFNDNGTGGDAVAGDNIFSYTATVSASTSDGSFNIPLTVTDAQARSNNGTAHVNVDVGELPHTAATVNSTGPINGSLASGADADMYLIHICDPANFTAVVDPAITNIDTQLFLFHMDGTGVAMDDDDPQGTNGLRSRLEGPLVQGIAPGDYLLAISSYDKDPVDASLAQIWADTPFNVVRAPDGPGAANPIDSWDAGGGGSGPYSIILTGVSASGCGPGNCCRSDYDGDGDVGTDFDIQAFFACLGGNCCATCPPDSDFNCDGDAGTDLDIEAFFSVLGGGPCL
jgi:hypothetical protein